MADSRKITELLLQRDPAPKLALNFSDPLELLVATILSAQCTDARVNAVTGTLFRKYRTAKDYARADPGILEEELRPTGFFKNKTKLVMSCCTELLEDFNGKVPATIEELTSLPGIGRKTANMVLGNAFGEPGIAVDTHVLRVSNRLGLVSSRNANHVEQTLMRQIPKAKWTAFTNAMILHGRGICTARNPHCDQCVLYDECEWSEKAAYRA